MRAVAVAILALVAEIGAVFWRSFAFWTKNVGIDADLSQQALDVGNNGARVASALFIVALFLAIVGE